MITDVNEAVRQLKPNVARKVNELFTIKRASHAAVENLNSTIGLFTMIQDHFQPSFEMVEVGSFEGTSTMMFALFTKTVYSVDCYDYVVPSTGRIPSHDQLFIDAEKVFLERTVNIPNIVKIRKTSVEAARDFADQSLDAVYIDAEHDEINIRTDIKTWGPKLKKGGVLSGHDFWLPHMGRIIREEGYYQDIVVFQDTSWLVKLPS